MVPPPTAPVWRCRGFDALSTRELDALFQVRQQVFVVEQACAYLDADGLDTQCLHLTGCLDGSLLPLAYARLLPPGLKYREASIGRVLTSERARNTGLGRELVRRAIVEVAAVFPGHAVRISAQAQLEAFYGGFGFAADQPPHIEDGIPHVEMVRQP